MIAVEVATLSPRILVVDDEPLIGALIADMLAAYGHRVTTLTSAADALRMLDAEPFDVILSDIRMPAMDGQTFYGELSRRDPDLARRLVFVTGDIITGEVSEFLDRTGAASLAKPFSLIQLGETVRRVLDSTG
jgi:CheY-like chemotaxis protein